MKSFKQLIEGAVETKKLSNEVGKTIKDFFKSEGMEKATSVKTGKLGGRNISRSGPGYQMTRKKEFNDVVFLLNVGLDNDKKKQADLKTKLAAVILKNHGPDVYFFNGGLGHAEVTIYDQRD